MFLNHVKKLFKKSKRPSSIKVVDWPYNYLLKAAYITTFESKYRPIQAEILDALDSHCSTCEAKLISIVFQNGTTQACVKCHNIDKITTLKHTNIH